MGARPCASDLIATAGPVTDVPDEGSGSAFVRPGPELLTWRVRSWGVGLAFDAVTDGQVGVGEAGSGLGELLAEGVQRAAAAGCGGGVEPDAQGVPGDVQVAGDGEHLAEQGAGFIVGPGSSAGAASGPGWTPVSYTHLTLPT